MARPVPADHETFLASLRTRHERQRGHDQAYEAMMYHARDPPEPATLGDIVRFTATERPEKIDPPPVPDDPSVYPVLSQITRTMQWPDPAPLAKAAKVLPGWDTLHVTTYLHTMIPDYPIWGPSESEGLRRLRIPVAYQPSPADATYAYRAYVSAVKSLREEARFEQVPESHQYLTRIVQAGLQQLGEA